MATRLLIDAAHPEETRVVVVSGTRLDEFDFESSTRKHLKGNIYLAKVTRVEPSLQAAFVEYGGNRHGFLAFGDIHPDYYQIPLEDRKALLEERAAEEEARENAEEAALQCREPARETAAGGDGADGSEDDPGEAGDEPGAAAAEAGLQPAMELEEPESVGGDEVEEVTRAPHRHTRRYKIQEVIKRRQVLLVQVVKEERGTKGAALTTYLSMAGRYCVLMPNTARGGGVSRKIADAADRKRLREIIDALKVPEGMGLIVRTAGQARTKAEIRRDYDYLLRVWDNVRELTLRSTAPTLVYEEASLIKRAVRDLYSSGISEVLVEGEDAYKAARGIMKMLMPSHAKRVQKYDDRIPLFHRYQVEEQLDQMHSPTVQLRSGGYIVLNPTEALVAIDVNSGRATRERNIEETALRTNLESAEEVARQLRLRDLAGLIVIDFIDMDESKNNRAVERKLKESLKNDRARIQVGRISAFGLLELSRQRLRPSLLEASTDICPTCKGTGLVRSTESAAMHVLRVVEDEGIRGEAGLTVEVPTAVAIFLLNQKRAALADMEQRFGLSVQVIPDPNLVPPDHRVARTARPDGAEARPRPSVIAATEVPEDEAEDGITSEAVEAGPEETVPASQRRRRGKRGGRKRRRPEPNDAVAADAAPEQDAAEPSLTAEADGNKDEGREEEEKPARRARRSRRGDRGRAGRAPRPAAAMPEATVEAREPEAAAEHAEKAPSRKPRRRRSRRRRGEGAGEPAPGPRAVPEAASDAEPSPPPQAAMEPTAVPITVGPAPKSEIEGTPPPEGRPEPPRRRGWWQFGR